MRRWFFLVVVALSVLACSDPGGIVTDQGATTDLPQGRDAVAEASDAALRDGEEALELPGDALQEPDDAVPPEAGPLDVAQEVDARQEVATPDLPAGDFVLADDAPVIPDPPIEDLAQPDDAPVMPDPPIEDLAQPDDAPVMPDPPIEDLARPDDAPVMPDPPIEDLAQPDDAPVMPDPPIEDLARPDDAPVMPDPVPDLPAEDSSQPDPGGTDACTPDCAGRECGDDGCGSSCGTCAAARCDGLRWFAGTACIEGACVPLPTEPAGSIDCDDGLGCTDDTCSPAEGCDSALRVDVCLVDGTCVADGAADPLEACRACRASLDPTAWTPVPDGNACASGRICREGACVESDIVCGGSDCPVLEGYRVQCNARGHCEYTNLDPTGWRRYDTWIHVPAGSFWMGAPASEPHATTEDPYHEVTFARGFLIGKYAVTVDQYEACHDDSPTDCPTASIDSWDLTGTRGVNTAAHGLGDHPQNGLTWAEAGAVCQWLGGRLPSESEWEYAAKGPVHRKYPWGATPRPGCSNQTAVFYDSGYTTYGCGEGGTMAVDSMGAGASWCGALNMSGNVREWVQDAWVESYSGAPTDGSAREPLFSTSRVTRGGNFSYPADEMRAARRLEGYPSHRGAGTGARCVRTLPMP